MSEYYDGTKLLSMTDSNGNKPEIYLCTTNRTGGKTTYFNKLVTKKYLKNSSKFGLFFRYKYELQDCAEKFFKDIGELFFDGYKMTSVSRGSGMFHELFLNDVSCGYAMAINSANQLKKYSHFFNDIDRIIFDEFQSEDNTYCSNEIKKFISLHQSIARGKGKQNRYVPVYMLGNTVSILNPYYVELGIADRLQGDTKFMKGDGWVLEQGFVESASIASLDSAFNRAFSNNKYVAYASQTIYLNDEDSFVEQINGKNRYFCTLKYDGCYYAVRYYTEQGIMYCDKRVDMQHPIRLSVTTSDHCENQVMLNNQRDFMDILRKYFDSGMFRFKDQQCKRTIIRAICY